MLKLTDKIVYKVDIEMNDGINETEFTSKYNNQTISFTNWTHENDLELSKFIWSLNDQNQEFDIQWSVFKKSWHVFKKPCNLWLLKKLVISYFKEKERLLNK